MSLNKFEEIEIWKLARVLSIEIFKYTSVEPFNKDFRFKDQIRSSSGSIMDNIAEGFERGGNKEFIQFLSIAKGSCGETRSQLHRALDYNYIDKDIFDKLYEMTITLSNQISGFIRYLKSSDLKGTKYH